MTKTKLSGAAFEQSADNTDIQENIECDLVINSTGFKVKPVSGALSGSHLSHSNGCLIDPSNPEKILTG